MVIAVSLEDLYFQRNVVFFASLTDIVNLFLSTIELALLVYMHIFNAYIIYACARAISKYYIIISIYIICI